MRVALLISGYLRSIKTNIPTLKEKIISNFDSVDTYLHLTENENIEDRYVNNISDEDINFIKDEINPIAIINEPNINYSRNKQTNNIINTWLKYYKLNQLKKSNENKIGEYDLVIKYRPDMYILSNINFNELNNNKYIYIPLDSKIDKNKLLNNTDKYLCDVFAYGGSKLMDKYFSLYEDIELLIIKYGNISETLLYHYLTENKIPFKLKNIDYNVILSSCNVFAIAGDSGSGKTTLGNILKEYFSDSLMLECDRYHKWERGDSNWDRLTHLNPDANYLTKMNEDIFDLKIGKDIYQVNYDHKNGKFTEKEHIGSSDNIIVCGLHSLYVENNNLYNLKIFIDTDKELKKKWKINRDVNERGYNKEKVLKQIEDRESDYIKHIYPQREISDIIINFYEKNGNLELRLLIKLSYNIDEILKKFTELNIQYINNNGDKFNEIIFTKYKPINDGTYNRLQLYDYYDYILYFIMNLN